MESVWVEPILPGGDLLFIIRAPQFAADHEPNEQSASNHRCAWQDAIAHCVIRTTPTHRPQLERGSGAARSQTNQCASATAAGLLSRRLLGWGLPANHLRAQRLLRFGLPACRRGASGEKQPVAHEAGAKRLTRETPESRVGSILRAVRSSWTLREHTGCGDANSAGRRRGGLGDGQRCNEKGKDDKTDGLTTLGGPPGSLVGAMVVGGGAFHFDSARGPDIWQRRQLGT
jgi:hypothetical protein